MRVIIRTMVVILHSDRVVTAKKILILVRHVGGLPN